MNNNKQNENQNINDYNKNNINNNHKNNINEINNVNNNINQINSQMNTNINFGEWINLGNLHNLVLLNNYIANLNLDNQNIEQEKNNEVNNKNNSNDNDNNNMNNPSVQEQQALMVNACCNIIYKLCSTLYCNFIAESNKSNRSL